MIKTSRILKADEHDDFYKSIVLKFLESQNVKPNMDGSITLFHGTSKKNAEAILKQHRFKGFPFFTHDRSIAERFSRQSKGTPTILTLQVNPAALTVLGGYLTARKEGLHEDQNRVWTL